MRSPSAPCIVLALALTACSGGLPPAGGAPPQAAAQAPAPGSGKGLPAAHGKIRTAFVIRVPKRHRRRGPRFVSPSTASGSLLIEPSLGCSTCSAASIASFGLTQDSPDCSLAADGLVCTIPLALNAGKYFGTVVLYDGPVKNGVPTGNVLSSDESLDLTIAPGKSNVPTVTLYGVPVNVTLTPLDSNAYVSYTNNLFPELIQIAAKSRARIQIYATDPDGNVILGPGAPTFSIAPAGGFTFASLGNGVYTLNAPGPYRGTVKLNLTISSPACSEPGAQCASIDSYDIVAGVDSWGATSNGVDTVYIDQSNSSKPLTITQGIAGPGPLAFDSKGDLFVGNATSHAITEYAFPYTAGPALTISNVGVPLALAFDTSDNLFVSDGHGIETYRASNYAAAPFVVATTTGATSLGVDSQGRLWAAYSLGAIRFPLPLNSTSTDASFLIGSPAQLCLDSSDDFYVISGGKIVNYTVSGGVYTKGTGSSLTGVTAIATFRPGGGNNDSLAAGTAATLNYMGVDSSGISTPSSNQIIQGANAMAFDQYGSVWASQSVAGGAVSWNNRYTNATSYFYAPGATGVAVYP
jgi:hypothetical protein